MVNDFGPEPVLPGGLQGLLRRWRAIEPERLQKGVVTTVLSQADAFVAQHLDSRLQPSAIAVFSFAVFLVVSLELPHGVVDELLRERDQLLVPAEDKMLQAGDSGMRHACATLSLVTDPPVAWSMKNNLIAAVRSLGLT